MLPPNRDSSTSLGRPLPYTLSPNLFTPLESPAACSRDEDIIPFRVNTGFNAPCEPPRWKVEDFLTGFTLLLPHLILRPSLPPPPHPPSGRHPHPYLLPSPCPSVSSIWPCSSDPSRPSRPISMGQPRSPFCLLPNGSPAPSRGHETSFCFY